MVDGDYMQITAHRAQIGWNQKVDDEDSWIIILLPHHKPIRTKSMSCTLTPDVAFKNFSIKRTLQFFWAWAAHSLCLMTCNKHCTCLYHKVASVDWLCCLANLGLGLTNLGDLNLLPLTQWGELSSFQIRLRLMCSVHLMVEASWPLETGLLRRRFSTWYSPLFIWNTSP